MRLISDDARLRAQREPEASDLSESDTDLRDRVTQWRSSNSTNCQVGIESDSATATNGQ